MKAITSKQNAQAFREGMQSTSGAKIGGFFSNLLGNDKPKPKEKEKEKEKKRVSSEDSTPSYMSRQ